MQSSRDQARQTAPMPTTPTRVPRAPITPASVERARTAKEHREKERQRQAILDHLAKLQDMRAQIEMGITDDIARATELGVSRVDIAAALGISRQAVQQRVRSLA